MTTMGSEGHAAVGRAYSAIGSIAAVRHLVGDREAVKCSKCQDFPRLR